MRLTAKRNLTFVFSHEDAIGLIPSAYLFRTDVNVGFYPTFFALGKTNEFALLSLNQNVGFHPTFFTLGRRSLLILLSLNQNVRY